MKWIKHNGGRPRGFKLYGKDCAPRAVAIAARISYIRAVELLKTTNKSGTSKTQIKKVLKNLGFVWVPIMGISETTIHVKREELPKEGRLILRLSKHVAAVVNGILFDNHDCSRKGTRLVYGYWIKKII